MVIVYAAVVTLTFEEKQYGVYALGYYTVVSFLQDILFSIKTHNELAEYRKISHRKLKRLSNSIMLIVYWLERINNGSMLLNSNKNFYSFGPYSSNSMYSLRGRLKC